ncbi:MAG: sigma-70 family RNA polymerase sigma factor, partial [Opitutaceae bacterium]
MIEDAELLRRYADEKSESAFAELVQRRIGLVYSVARRHTGDAHRAEDVTQAVFTALARKAGPLSRRPVLVGWLYRSAQFAASDAVRAERRRQARETEAHLMEQIAREGAEPDWEKLQPVLDEVLNDLPDADRDAVLLRFFDGQPFAEIGRKLNLSENTARMRVERTLDKLHVQLARRGVTSTTAALGLAMANQTVLAAPVGLAMSVTGAALAGSAVSGGALGVGTFITMTKFQLGFAGVLAAVAVGGLVVQRETHSNLQREIEILRLQQPSVTRLLSENLGLEKNAAHIAALRKDTAGLDGLRRLAETMDVSRRELDLMDVRQEEVEEMRQEAAKLLQTPVADAIFVAQSLDALPKPRIRRRPVYPRAL